MDLRSVNLRKLFYKNIMRNPSNGRVRMQGVIKAFNVGKDGILRDGAGIIAMQMDELALQTAEEIFRHGVVVGVAPAGHALPDTVLGQALPIGGSNVLDAAVRGDVAHPCLIWLLKGKPTLEQIGRDGVAVLGVGGCRVGMCSCRMAPIATHELVYSLAGAAVVRSEHVIQAVQPQGQCH